MIWYFVFFFLSGFCAILYEVVWMRLAMAQFGVTTALVSMVLSVFMAGMGGGSVAAGSLVKRYGEWLKPAPLRLYAAAEFLIGVSALLVPREFNWGHQLLVWMAERAPVASGTYYVVSGVWLALSLVPWCACMGATIPLAMFAIQTDQRDESRRSFSFLYLANVLGAAAGCLIPLLLIELYGFQNTLHVGTLLNAGIAASAYLLTLAPSLRPARVVSQPGEATVAQPQGQKELLALLFTTGFTTMGMEVVWIRLFTPYAGPFVYTFALILGTYLLSTFAGSQAYRFWSRRSEHENRLAWVALGLLGVLPLIASDARTQMGDLGRVVLGVAPFSAAVGFLTPMLVDRWAAGDPDRAGRAYAVNVAGCIMGPLVSGFVLLPFVGERVSLLVLAMPWLAMVTRLRASRKFQLVLACGLIATSLAVVSLTQDFETQFLQRKVLRDSTATVMATGAGQFMRLLVNGNSMTCLTPITKMMAHFPLASLDHPPRKVLVICFGMGTTFRSAVSWGIRVTAVDLVPSVPKLFTYYHPDGDKVLASPLAHVVTDDGRRYLERSAEQYDLITIDPPPPMAAAGSSLLYSLDFYKVINRHLEPGGILAQWFPGADAVVQSSVMQALRDSFPYLRVRDSVDHVGSHILASNRPIPTRTAAELLARMPPPAVADMMEWGPASTPGEQLNLMLSTPLTLGQMIALAPDIPPLSDDRPINEYHLFRTDFFPVYFMLRHRWD